jgi:hypothetical protein
MKVINTLWQYLAHSSINKANPKDNFKLLAKIVLNYLKLSVVQLNQLYFLINLIQDF